MCMCRMMQFWCMWKRRMLTHFYEIIWLNCYPKIGDREFISHRRQWPFKMPEIKHEHYLRICLCNLITCWRLRAYDLSRFCHSLHMCQSVLPKCICMPNKKSQRTLPHGNKLNYMQQCINKLYRVIYQFSCFTHKVFMWIFCHHTCAQARAFFIHVAHSRTHFVLLWFHFVTCCHTKRERDKHK